jgi:heat shock protein HtpX
MKRIFLFLVTNIAVLLVLAIVARLLGVDRIAPGQYGALLVFAAIFGMGGSFISLAISKWSAKRAMGVRVITEPRGDAEQWLVNAVARHAQAAGIGMPEVGVFDAAQPNAFATGARRDAALVAVSAGLFQSMNREQIDAVLGHEITHVANGDMVTLALIQGVLNTFVIFLSRILGSVVDKAVFRSEREHGPGYFLSVMALQILFGLLASLIVFWFSRQREFRADAGGAASPAANMIARCSAARGERAAARSARGVRHRGRRQGFSRLFASHPPIEERIARLETMQA